MPATDLICAELCVACYNSPEIFDRIVDSDGVWAGVKHYDDATVVAFRGSSNFMDWQRDFDAVMVNDPDLGRVEQGFMEGVRSVDIAVELPHHAFWITGHSLGAAHALLYAGLLAKRGLLTPDVDEVVTFGSPRPGSQELKDILAPLPIRSYRNRHDPVTCVPIDLPEFPYMHPRDLIPVDVPPSHPDSWGLLADHHSELYLQAMQKAA